MRTVLLRKKIKLLVNSSVTQHKSVQLHVQLLIIIGIASTIKVDNTLILPSFNGCGQGIRCHRLTQTLLATVQLFSSTSFWWASLISSDCRHTIASSFEPSMAASMPRETNDFLTMSVVIMLHTSVIHWQTFTVMRREWLLTVWNCAHHPPSKHHRAQITCSWNSYSKRGRPVAETSCIHLVSRPCPPCNSLPWSSQTALCGNGMHPTRASGGRKTTGDDFLHKQVSQALVLPSVRGVGKHYSRLWNFSCRPCTGWWDKM